MSTSGRHRGKEHSDEELKLEAKAKGHREELNESTSLDAVTGEVLEAQQQPPIANENFGHRERGHQHGFGKNQGKEGRDMNTGIGTRSLGSEHS